MAIEYAELTELYLLRIVCAAAQLNPRVPVDEIFLELFGTRHSDNKNRAEKLERLAQRLRQLEVNPPEHKGPLFNNIERLGERLGLDKCARNILAFRILVRTREALENVLQSFGKISEARLASVIACALRCSSSDVERALAFDGALVGSALIRIEQSLQCFIEKLPLVVGLPNAMLRPQPTLDASVKFAITKSSPSVLAESDFPHLCDAVELLKTYMRSATSRQTIGVNVLLFGTPGVGKTELARLIATLADLDLYEIASASSDDYELTTVGRYAHLRLNQRYLAALRNAIVLFDEAEDALSKGDGSGDQQHGKAWINRLLEHNEVPTVWIANSVDRMDPAVLRRFDYVLEMRNPPLSVRRRFLGKALQGMPVRARWLDEQAINEHLTPALVERAARVLNAAGSADSGTVEKRFSQLVEANLAAQGFGSRPIGFST